MYKQVIIFRKDIIKKIGIGKLISHACHASLGSLRNAEKKTVERWEKEGAKKVALKVENLEELKSLYKKVKNRNLPCFLVRDAGLTQLPKGTITCLAIGPTEEKKVDEVTGKLKLL